MDPKRLSISTVDYHTAGEPYRIVVGGGGPALKGETVLERRSDAIDRLDHIRRLLVNEPRGHADMYGCFITPSDDAAAEFGMVFFHKDGFSTACGHGTIAGATWALDSGFVVPTEPLTRFNIDVPSGRLAVEADVDNGRVGQVRFTNVPAQIRATDIAVSVNARTLTVDIAYGGAHYAVVPSAEVGFPVEARYAGEFIGPARAIKSELDGHPSTDHPDDDRLSGLYGVIFHDEEPGRGLAGAALAHRNITVFADGEVDRSPCGSGTSARLALLHHRGELREGQTLSHRGIAGGLFSGRILSAGPAGVVTQVGGRASLTGFHTFVLEADDELGIGFQLR